jgi:hypothetical protein
MSATYPANGGEGIITTLNFLFFLLIRKEKTTNNRGITCTMRRQGQIIAI